MLHLKGKHLDLKKKVPYSSDFIYIIFHKVRDRLFLTFFEFQLLLMEELTMFSFME